MKPRSAIKTDLFADEHHRKRIDELGDPLADIESHIDFASLAAEVDKVSPRPVSAGRASALPDRDDGSDPGPKVWRQHLSGRYDWTPRLRHGRVGRTRC